MKRACARSAGLEPAQHLRPWCPLPFPSTPDTGPGLTDLGKALVKACNERRIAIDLSHLNEKGFWEVARLSDAPLIATHSNAHAVSPHARNLTDRQLAAIRDSGGMVGINFATCFLRPDGQVDTNTGLDLLFRHLDHLIQQVGIDSVGFGSDFDGAKVPDAIGDVAASRPYATRLRRAVSPAKPCANSATKTGSASWNAPGASSVGHLARTLTAPLQWKLSLPGLSRQPSCNQLRHRSTGTMGRRNKSGDDKREGRSGSQLGRVDKA